MSDSPIASLLTAIDSIDSGAVMSLLAADIRLLTVDGRRAEGLEAVRGLVDQLLGSLRHTEHRITNQWNVEDVWIAEVDASYELLDYLELKRLPRAFVVRARDGLITEVRAYGAHEHPLTDHRTGEEGMWVGSRWIPPL